MLNVKNYKLWMNEWADHQSVHYKQTKIASSCNHENYLDNKVSIMLPFSKKKEAFFNDK